MDIQGALKAGYSKEEIAQEIQSRYKIDAPSALKEGYDLPSILDEGRRRLQSDPKDKLLTDGNTSLTKDYRTNVDGGSSYKLDIDNLMSKLEAIAPLGKMSADMIGAAKGAQLGAKLPLPHPALRLGAALIGAGLGYAGVKGITDTMENPSIRTEPLSEQITNATQDFGMGLLGEGSGRAIVKAMPYVAKYGKVALEKMIGRSSGSIDEAIKAGTEGDTVWKNAMREDKTKTELEQNMLDFTYNRKADKIIRNRNLSDTQRQTYLKMLEDSIDKMDASMTSGMKFEQPVPSNVHDLMRGNIPTLSTLAGLFTGNLGTGVLGAGVSLAASTPRVIGEAAYATGAAKRYIPKELRNLSDAKKRAMIRGLLLFPNE